MSILARAYGPTVSDLQNVGTVLGGMTQARLADRPPIPQVDVRPPQPQAQQSGGSGLGQILGLVGSLAGAYFTGGASLAAGAAGGAAGGLLGRSLGG